MKTYAIARSDGGVMILSVQDFSDVTEEMAKMNAAEPGRYLSHREITAADVPADRSFRDAWVDTGTAIDHDISKAREITKERLRRERDFLFAANDATLLAAVADNNIPAKMVAIAERDRLRDITKAADAAVSLAELKALKAAK